MPRRACSSARRTPAGACRPACPGKPGSIRCPITGRTPDAFEYEKLELDRTEITRDGALRATVTVRNTGSRAGKEAV